VEQAIALLQSYTIDFGNGPPLHYFVADASGRSAVIEYLAEEMRVTHNDRPWQVATNFVLAQEQFAGADSPCWRYNRAYEKLLETGGALSRGEAMVLLANVAQRNTVWSVVYDLSHGHVDVTMGRNYERVHEFVLTMENEG
jgi:choloylglycine hydrolase